MGASISQILMLLAKGFTYLVIISFIIACLVTWYFMDNWLENFAYQTTLSSRPFLLGGFGYFDSLDNCGLSIGQGCFY